MTPAATLTRRQRQILDFYRDYSETNHLSPTLEEVAQHFGLNKVTIFGHVSELQRKGALTRSAKGVSRGLTIASDESDKSTILPVLGTIAAGAPIATIEERESLDLADLVPPTGDVYVLRVSGESMIEDAICNEDLVLVERRQEARNGETVVAVLPEEEATLKRFYLEGDQVRLQPANSTMQPIYAPASDVEIRGVVIGVVRKF